MRISVFGVLVAGLLAAQAGCQRTSARAQLAKDQAAEQTAFEALLAGKNADGDRAMEAREYLADQMSNKLWKTSREQTTKWVDELYQAGAVKVYAVYSPAEDGVRVNLCAALLVELSPQREMRVKVIEAFNHIDRKLWGDDHTTVADTGQKYLDLSMDP